MGFNASLICSRWPLIFLSVIHSCVLAENSVPSFTSKKSVCSFIALKRKNEQLFIKYISRLSVRRLVKNVVFKWNPCFLIMFNFNSANKGYLNGPFISSPLFYTLLTFEILRFQCFNFHGKILLKGKIFTV